MDKTMPCTCGSFDKLAEATALLDIICSGLEADEIQFPPPLLNWWINRKKELEDDKPRIHLVN